jgi:hypothetical protein
LKKYSSTVISMYGGALRVRWNLIVSFAPTQMS